MTREDIPNSAAGEFSRPPTLPSVRSVLHGRRASLLGPWNWLDQLRFRFDLAIEVLDPDLTYVLSAAPAVGRAPDVRSALLDQRDLLRLTTTNVLRLEKARSFTVGGLRIRVFPLLGGRMVPRQPLGLLLVGDTVSAESLTSIERMEEIDRRLDAAGQWLTAAIEGMVGGTGARREDTPSPSGLESLIDVVEALYEVEDARQLIELTVEAIALWYDADVRAYRRDLTGSFVLETWLPGIDVGRVPRALSGNGIWEREKVFRLESMQDLEHVGWDVRGAETLFVPITYGDSVRWLITVSAGSDDGLEAMLEFFRRVAGLLLDSLERDAEDAIRHRVAERLCVGDAPFSVTIQLGVEASAEGIGASAGRLEVFYAGSSAAALSSTWGSFAPDAERVPNDHEAATAHTMTLRKAISAQAMAVFSYQKQIGSFSLTDVRLARSAVTAFANWLAGTLIKQEERSPAPPGPPLGFVARLGRDIERARRENRGGALAVMRPSVTSPRGSELDELALMLGDHVRSSDLIGIISDTAAAWLRELPAGLTSALTDRLLRAASEHEINVRVHVLPLASSSESPEALVRRALSSTGSEPDLS